MQRENNASAALQLGAAVPVLRITSVEDAYDFYLGILGMTVDWEHRFEPGLPLYAQVSRAGLVLHLSEHAGDGSPVAAVWIGVPDVRSLHTELLAVDEDGVISDIDEDAPGGPTFEALDPFDNRLRFAQASRVG